MAIKNTLHRLVLIYGLTLMGSTTHAEPPVAPVDPRIGQILVSPEMTQAARLAAQVRPNAAMLEQAAELKRVVDKATEDYKSKMEPTIASNGKTDTKSKPISRAAHKGRLYVFVSKSVPTTTLRRYAAAMEDAGLGSMVMNGFVGGAGALKPTMAFIHSVVAKDAHCHGAGCKIRNVAVDVNPILFRKYAIEHVPAFVWEPEPKDAFCDDDLKPLAGAIVIEGDADLYYVLETLEHITHDPELQAINKEHLSL